MQPVEEKPEKLKKKTAEDDKLEVALKDVPKVDTELKEEQPPRTKPKTPQKLQAIEEGIEGDIPNNQPIDVGMTQLNIQAEVV